MGNRDKINAPFLYDNLDSPNAPRHIQTPPTAPAQSYAIPLIITVAVFVAAVVAYGLFWLNSIAYYSATATALLWFISGGVAVSIVLLLGILVFWLLLRALKDAVISLDDGVPVSVIGVWLQTLNTQRAADRYYDVMQTRAKESTYQGVSTLTLDKSVQTETSTTTVATPDDSSHEDTVITPPHKNTLEDLRDKGFITRSNNSIMIGYTHDN